MIVDTKIGDRNVVASGVIVIPPNDDTWEISFSGLIYRFTFIERGGEIPRVEFPDHSEKSMKMDLIDWHNPLGTSYVLKKIATVAGLNYDICFFVQTIGEKTDATRLVNFSVSES
jgi:hypothetical protein